MKLEVFDFIDDTLRIIEEQDDVLHKVAGELEKFFNDSFFIKDHFLNVNYRLKSQESLKEKILRHNFYIKYKTPENLVKNLSDLIGFRIECRFVEDESRIYNEIVELFQYEKEDGYYSNPINSSILLKLDDEQPQTQKNGFEIYKIDGMYSKDDIVVNFELQIKSLVNLFWGDIDHRILYKNYNYMLRENFLRDVMSSIKDHLTMIDRQLMILYKHVNGMNASNAVAKKAQFYELLSKIINDIYTIKVKEEIGFVVDFKKSTDVIVDYIFTKAGEEDSENYSQNFLKTLNRLNKVSEDSTIFDNYIDFERELFFNDDFTRKLGKNILDVINKDFRWNLFFRIIFEIEGGEKAELFEDFIHFLRYKFYDSILVSLEKKNLDSNERDYIHTLILDRIYQSFSLESSIDFINECSVKKLKNKIMYKLESMEDFNGWKAIEDDICNIILNHSY